MNAITETSTVTIHYRIALQGDGSEVDSTFGEEPLTFTLGSGMMGDGLEECLVDMEEGDHETFELDPDEAFGFPDTDNIHTMPRSDFPDDMLLEPGAVIGFGVGEAGETEIPGMILEVDEEQVKVDFNHPLAGQAIWFEVQVVKVEPSA